MGESTKESKILMLKFRLLTFVTQLHLNGTDLYVLDCVKQNEGGLKYITINVNDYSSLMW